MYINEVANLTAKVFRDKKQLNILCAPTHERYETNLAKTGHNFFAIRAPHIKDWQTKYAPVPANYTVYSFNRGEAQVPPHQTFDLILSQNKFGQYQNLGQIAYHLSLPMISMEHTLPVPQWPREQLENCKKMQGTANVFITHYNKSKWGFDDVPNSYVIGHPVDTDTFCSNDKERNNHILTVANDYIGRDWCLNFSQYKRVCLDNKLPIKPVGDTPGLSLPAKSLSDLVEDYQTSRIFFNTAHISPIPMSLLEAMSCGCACVSIRACAIPEYIEHGVNGLLYDTDEEALASLKLLLIDKDLAAELGKAARKTIIEKCRLERFIGEWNNLFDKVIK